MLSHSLKYLLKVTGAYDFQRKQMSCISSFNKSLGLKACRKVPSFHDVSRIVLTSLAVSCTLECVAFFFFFFFFFFFIRYVRNVLLNNDGSLGESESINGILVDF